MKRSTLIYTLASGILVCVLCCYLIIITEPYAEERLPAPVAALKEQVPAVIKPLRERITFILGEDREADNRYYAEARNYYDNNEAGRTEYLVTTCRSLLEVREYLEQYKPCNGQPWGLINLVSHGNQWTGLSVRVTPEIKRTTADKLEACITDGSLKPLPDALIDEETEIILHGCGVGNNQCLVDMLATAFGGSDHLPVVRASKLFEYYTSATVNGKQQTAHYLADTWMTSYRMGDRPADAMLANTLRETYPAAAVDWDGALHRDQPRWIGDTYHYTFEVPVKWILRLSHDSIPGSGSNLQAWIARRHEITRELNALQIPYENFNWSFTKVYADNNDGSKSPAIWVKGYCTVLTVLQPLTSDDNNTGLNKPFEPMLSDSDFYYTAAKPLAAKAHVAPVSTHALCEL
jgi:hypothetical protein